MSPDVRLCQQYMRSMCPQLNGDCSGSFGEVSLLCPPQPEADDVSKLLLTAADGRRVAVILLSAEAAPNLVARGAAVSRDAKESLGDSLGEAVITPLIEGVMSGRSFAVLPYYEPLANSRIGWFVKRASLRRRILEWLRRVTEATKVVATGEEADRDFRAPLLHVAEDVHMSDRIREAATRAADRLGSGQWIAQYVLSHNDLWKGNLLSERTGCGETKRSGTTWGFKVIDWLGGRRRGHAIYDLIRLTSSLAASRDTLLQELAAHCEILGCDLDDTLGYFLSSTGYLGTRLEHFSRARYVASTEKYFRVLEAAMK